MIIHEVGHFWYPMIVNSDERQWTWMDEGVNTYHQFLAERSWEEDYARSRGLPRAITGYMRDHQNARPVMTASESILQFGPNAYAKPATALNILRETVVGRDLFDQAMKVYTNRWAFKRPEPADFFRSIEDASGRDLDWFWRGWFFDTRPVGIDDVETYQVRSGRPDVAREADRAKEAEDEPETVTAQRNDGIQRRTDRFPELIDFYNTRDKHAVTPADERAYEKLLAELDEDDEGLLDTSDQFHIIRFNTNGGLVMPLPLRVTYADGSTEELIIPADLWRADQRTASKMLIRPQAIDHVMLDPHDELADVDRTDNRYPRTIAASRFALHQDSPSTNPMREAARESARTRTAESIAAWADSMCAKWRDAGSGPRAQVDAVMNPLLPDDGWGHSMRLVLGQRGEVDLDVWLVSDGPDGVPGTPDDLSARVSRDGTVDALRAASERPRTDLP